MHDEVAQIFQFLYAVDEAVTAKKLVHHPTLETHRIKANHAFVELCRLLRKEGYGKSK